MYRYNEKVSKTTSILSQILTTIIYLILIAIALSLLSLLIDFIMWVWG